MRQENAPPHRPVVIGGVGGSGTRVAARIVRELGFDLGVTNHAHDELFFALLVNRPRWYFEADPAEIECGIELYARVRTGLARLAPSDLPFVAEAFVERLVHRYNRNQSFGEKLMLAANLLPGSEGRHAMDEPVGWGWKDPPSHVFVDHLAEQFPGMRYIHLVRHGLDMAFSDNQNQLYNWGRMFGLHPPFSDEELPNKSATYWLEANERAIGLAEEALGDRALVVRFERMCRDSRPTVERIAEFLDRDVPGQKIDEIAEIPRLPDSVGRHRERDLEQFSDEVIAGTERLGFEVG